MADPDPLVEIAKHGGSGLTGAGVMYALGRFFGRGERDELLSAVAEIKVMVADVAASVHELRRDLAVTTERATAVADRMTKAEEEIKLLRERYHDLVSTVEALKGQLYLLDERRGTGEHRAVTP